MRKQASFSSWQAGVAGGAGSTRGQNGGPRGQNGGPRAQNGDTRAQNGGKMTQLAVEVQTSSGQWPALSTKLLACRPSLPHIRSLCLGVAGQPHVHAPDVLQLLLQCGCIKAIGAVLGGKDVLHGGGLMQAYLGLMRRQPWPVARCDTARSGHHFSSPQLAGAAGRMERHRRKVGGPVLRHSNRHTLCSSSSHRR